MAEVFPRKYGRYRLLGILGAGGMGVVYRAETEPLAGITRSVAIKTLQPGTGDLPADEMIDMLLDEARIWVRLQHPNIVSVVDFGSEKGDWFLALELIEGVTAQELVDRDGRLPVPEALCIVERVARALAYAHSASGDDKKKLRIVHRDVKPGNILLSSRGEIKLTDFGIARATDRRVATQAGQVRGSLRVMSPEQVLGEALDARSDLFSLGCTLHELLTANPLLAGPREAVLAALAQKKIPAPDPSLPPVLRELIARLTSAEPARRPANAEEVARQARAMLLPETVEDIEQALAERIQRLRGTDPVDEERKTASGHSAADTTQPRAPEDTVRGPAAAETAPLPGASPSPLPPAPVRPIAEKRPLPAPSLGIPKRWMFHLRIGGALAAALVATYYAISWVSCTRAEADLARKRAGEGTLAELAEQARACIRFCRTDADRRGTVAIASFLTGSPAADAAYALRSEPYEERLRATLLTAQAGWSSAAAQKHSLTLPPSSDSACLASALAFNAGATPAIGVPPEARATSCGVVLAASEQTRLGKLDAAFALLERANEGRSARLAYAVALAQQQSDRIAEAKIDAALRAGDVDPTGAWIPASWRLIPGDRGRVTTPLDDVPALGWMLQGDVRARAGDFAGARAFYARAEQRGYRAPDLYARLVDLQIDRRQMSLLDEQDISAIVSAVLRLAKSADARLGTVDGLVARVALAHLAARDPAAAETALAMVRDPGMREVLEAQIQLQRTRRAR